MAGPTPIRQFRIRRGLDIRVPGAPEQMIAGWRETGTAAVLAGDYRGVTPRLLVREGDSVALGQPLFEDRRRPGIKVTSPTSGTVAAINRGERRRLTCVVVQRSGSDERLFPAHDPAALERLSRETAAETLLSSGLWAALRNRPFGHVPDPGSAPQAIFVTAIDSNPLAADPEVIVAPHADDFTHGLTVLTRLTDGPVHLCRRPGAAIPPGTTGRVAVAEFDGPHPAGLPGTHIHLLAPVGPRRQVWHLGYQEVIAIGRLFTTGRLWAERVVSIAGPGVLRPRLVRTLPGAAIPELLAGELGDGPYGAISGPVLAGHRAEGPRAYLGRHHLQVSVLGEGAAPAAGLDRWISPGSLLGRVLHGRKSSAATTALNGQPTALIPLDGFERVIPLDILPVPLFRALLVGDTDAAAALGCLELDEEDLALATYLCPGKQEYGALLRAALDTIAREDA